MSFLRSSRRTLAILAASVAGVLSACSSNAVSPVGDATTDLDAQMAANLAIMAEAKQHSAAVYDSLTNVWKARTDGGRRGMMNTASSSPFVACAPLPYDGDAKIVGSGGGVFYFGPHRLYVPAGALSVPTAIAVIVQTDLKTEVTLLPHGTQFNSSVKLTLAYAQCESSPTHRVAYVDALNNILAWPSSYDHPESQTVDAWLNHFSQYAIAY